jgi:hypothetical protein
MRLKKEGGSFMNSQVKVHPPIVGIRTAARMIVSEWSPECLYEELKDTSRMMEGLKKFRYHFALLTKEERMFLFPIREVRCRWFYVQTVKRSYEAFERFGSSVVDPRWDRLSEVQTR